MARETYNDAIKNLLVHEGGKVNHPKDPGGRTNMGITQRVYDGWRRNRKLSTKSVYEISIDEVRAIYKANYADKIQYDRLPPGVDYFVFDGAVNSGPSQSIKWLQRGLGTVKVDGILGEATLSAVATHPNHDELIAAMAARRFGFLKALKTWKTFGKGWTRRVNEVTAVGQAWAMGSVGPAVHYVAGGAAKGRLEDAKTVPGKSIADATAGGGVVGATVTQATETLSPLATVSSRVQTFLTVITVTAAVLATVAIAYRIWATQKQKAIDDALDKHVIETTPANDNELELQAADAA